MPNANADLPIQQLKQKLNQLRINHLAKQCGFIQRKPRKIFPTHLLISLLLLVLGSGNSLDNMATKIGLLSGQTISKQAVFKRINDNLLLFLKTILAMTMMLSSKIKYGQTYDHQLFSGFNRVLVEDSTSIKLDPMLSKDFPGGRNQTGKTSATLKIHAIIDILTERFFHFDICAFTKNDQRCAKDILSLAKASDLLIRDLGYFSLAVLKKLRLAKIFFFEPVANRCNYF